MNTIKDKKLITSIFFPFLALLVEFAISMFITPLVSDKIGTDAYGFIALAKNFASYALILTTALNSYAARYISVEYHKENYDKANIYFTSTFFSNVLLSGIIVLIGGIVVLFLEFLLNIPEHLVFDVKILFVFIFINFFISCINTSYSSSSLIANKVDLNGVFKTVAYLTEAVFLVYVYHHFPPHVFYMGMGIALASFIVFSSDIFITLKYVPKIHLNKKFFSMNAVKELVVNGIWNSINALGNMLNSGLDLMITNLMLSPFMMGQLAFSNVINSMLSCLYQLLSRPFYPTFLKHYAQKEYESLKNDLFFSMKISGLGTALSISGFIGLGKPFFEIWIPNQDIDLIYKITVLVLSVGITQGVVYPLYYIYTLTIKNKIPCIITIVGGLMNIASMYILLKYSSLGLYSIVITTLVIMSFINLVTNPLYMSHCLKFPKKTFYPTIFRHVIAFLVMSIVFYTLTLFFDPHGIIMFIIFGIIYVLIGFFLYLSIVFNKNERENLIAKIRREN